MIYKIVADRQDYMNAYLDPLEVEATLGDFFLLDKPFWSDFWKPVIIKFHDDSDGQRLTKIPDITVLETTSNLICSAKGKKAIGDLISNFGEWLPVLCEGIEYWLFHLTNTLPIDVIDTKQSERTIDVVGYTEAQRIVLKEGSLPELAVFNTEYNGKHNIYCTDGFYAVIKEVKLVGLRFSMDHSNSSN